MNYMKKYILYSHAGSNNHGCEALLRTTVATIDEVECVYSGNVQADEKYGLAGIVSLKADKGSVSEGTLKDIVYSIKYKLFKDDKLYFRKLYRKFIQEIKPNKVYLSIGGDNYCYHFSEWLEVLNTEINKKGSKSVLWGCSINADELENTAVVADLERYSLITVRESLTYELLKQKLSNPRIEYVPDTAFLLPTSKVALPNGFIEGKTIGVNVSSVILENSQNKTEVLNGFVELVNHIIEATDYQIALIPHVVIPGNDDREILRMIYDRCEDQSRMILVEDANCTVLKGYIARCNMFIGARTHATIAAYSSLIPTLVIGYSVKSLGIAKDLFGTNENYVLPVQSIINGHELIKSFDWLNENQDLIKEKLKRIMPDYIERIKKVRRYLEDL